MEKNQFKERQYLGLNKMSIFRRISLAIFCFILFYWRENHEKSGDLFFLLGIIILIISIILVFILHFETSVSNGSIKPHCEECNNLGATTLALESIFKLTLRKCDKALLNDNLFKGATLQSIKTVASIITGLKKNNFQFTL